MVAEKMAETPDRPPRIINITCGVEVGKLIVAKFGPRGTSRCIEHPLVKDHLLNPIEFTALGTRMPFIYVIAFYSGVWNIYEKIFFLLPISLFWYSLPFFLLPVPFFLALFLFLSFFPFSPFQFRFKTTFWKASQKQGIEINPVGGGGHGKGSLYIPGFIVFSLQTSKTLEEYPGVMVFYDQIIEEHPWN